MTAQFTDRKLMIEFLKGLHLVATSNNMIVDITTTKIVGRVHEFVKGTLEVVLDVDC